MKRSELEKLDHDELVRLWRKYHKDETTWKWKDPEKYKDKVLINGILYGQRKAKRRKDTV